MQNIALISLYWLHVGVTILVGMLTCFKLLQSHTIQVTAPSLSNHNSIVEWNTKLGPHIDTHCPFPKNLSSLLETYLLLWNLIPCSGNLSVSLSLSLSPYYRLPPIFSQEIKSWMYKHTFTQATGMHFDPFFLSHILNPQSFCITSDMCHFIWIWIFSLSFSWSSYRLASQSLHPLCPGGICGKTIFSLLLPHSLC